VTALHEAEKLLRIWQTNLGASWRQCDTQGKALWDRIEETRGRLNSILAPGSATKFERMAFYEEALKDPRNHGAIALELAYL
jgi:hypothetical protein